MSVTFAKAATTVKLQNPDVQNVLSIDKTQVVNRSAAGDRYRYDRGVDVRTMRLHWGELRESEKAALESFFDTTADGVMNAFTYTDHRGIAWDAYFVEPALAFTEVADSQSGAAGTFQVDGATGAAYPTTTRTSGVWSVDVVLEVSVPA